MVDGVRDVLAGIATVEKMTVAFQDEDHCRQLLEALVWPRGCICPACSYRCSTALAGRDIGWRARSGLIGASPRRDADRPRLGRGRKGQPRTTKTPVLAVAQRPEQFMTVCRPAQQARESSMICRSVRLGASSAKLSTHQRT